MKIVSTLKSSKADKETKHVNLLGANQRIVRHSGSTYLIHAAQLGDTTIAEASIVKGSTPTINLFGKDKLAQELKKLCENRLYS